MKNQRKTRSITTGISDYKLRDTSPPPEKDAFEICHVSHFPVDVDLVSNRGHVLGRPWVAVLTDDLSRRALATNVTFAPSDYSSLILLTLCLHRWGCLPQIVVFEKFTSPQFDVCLTRLGIIKRVRSLSPQFSSVAERRSSALKKMVFEKRRGKAAITRDGRKREMEITLEGFYRILREYFGDIHLNTSQTAADNNFR